MAFFLKAEWDDDVAGGTEDREFTKDRSDSESSITSSMVASRDGISARTTPLPLSPKKMVKLRSLLFSPTRALDGEETSTTRTDEVTVASLPENTKEPLGNHTTAGICRPLL